MEPDTPAAPAGLATGDLIVGVNRTAVGSLNDIVPPPQTRNLLLLSIYRDDHALRDPG